MKNGYRVLRQSSKLQKMTLTGYSVVYVVSSVDSAKTYKKVVILQG